MSYSVPSVSSRIRAQAEELIDAIEGAETVIVTTIERECEALRTGRMLAAEALHLRLTDAARLYMNATRAARASLETLEQVLPDCRDTLDGRRRAFAALLKVELAILAAERAVVGQSGRRDHDEAKMSDVDLTGRSAEERGRVMPSAPSPTVRSMSDRHTPVASPRRKVR